MIAMEVFWIVRDLSCCRVSARAFRPWLRRVGRSAKDYNKRGLRNEDEEKRKDMISLIPRLLSQHAYRTGSFRSSSPSMSLRFDFLRR
jgi:hypothetical protein